MSLTLVAFLLYMSIILVLGVISWKKHTDSPDDFFLGGRKMNKWVVALSAVASGRSAWLLLGLAGIAYKFGISAVWAVVGYISVELFMFVFLGHRLRQFTEKKEALTVPAYLEERFGDRSHTLAVLTTLVMIFFFFIYISAQLLGGGKAFAESFGLTNTSGILITAGIIVLYTAFGGFVAVSWTDVVQSLFMIVGLVILPMYVIFFHLGGMSGLYQGLSEISYEALGGQKGGGVSPWVLGLGGILGYIGIGLGSPGNPHILVRYMSIDKASHLRRAALIGTIWNVVMAWGAILAGLAARVYIPEAASLPVKGGGGPDYDKAFLVLAQSFLHPALYGVIIASVFAAIMSTIDSQLLLISSSVTEDFYKRIFGQKGGEKFRVALGRITVAGVIIAAIVLGSLAKESIFWLVLLAWGGLGASLGPAILLSLYWKRMTTAGALAGILTGAVVTLFWKYPDLLGAVGKVIGSVKEMTISYELVPGFLFSALAIIITSLLTSPPEDAEKRMAEMD